MGYSRFSTRFRKRGFRKIAVVAKPKRIYRKKTNYKKVSFAKRVNAIIAKNIENKMSGSINQNNPIMKWPTGQNSPEWNLIKMTDIFDRAQGVTQSTRIGNQIKLKRWIIKGCIHPNQDVNPTDSTAQYLRYSFQGYATLYLCRKVDCSVVPVTLQKFYQDGASYNDPTGNYLDHMLKVNTDSYKIYWRKRFKLGPSATYEGTGGSNRMLNNNDFKLVADFGIDICKYIGKNHIIKYEDGATPALVSAAMENLVLAVVWSPPFGIMTAAGSIGNTNSQSFYNLTTTMYYEFEDA